MLTLVSAEFAKVEELFKYKSQGFELKAFPGYTDDQWGIKAHNRPWIDDVGKFRKGQRIIEVGGAYSTLPEYLAEKYKLEAWIGDDFGIKDKEKVWSRWGDPRENIKKNPNTRYVFKQFGEFAKEYPDGYFDRIFSVSTLEHIDPKKNVDVFKDMNRCVKKGGMQLHAIDVAAGSFSECLRSSMFDKIPFIGDRSLLSEAKMWGQVLMESGVKLATKLPSSLELLDRSTLIESPEVTYRYIPPNNTVKPYRPTASLLLVIKDL